MIVMKDPMQRLHQMLLDVQDTNAALSRAACGGTVERCECGAFTLRAPCPKCVREAEAKADKEKE